MHTGTYSAHVIPSYTDGEPVVSENSLHYALNESTSPGIVKASYALNESTSPGIVKASYALNESTSPEIVKASYALNESISPEIVKASYALNESTNPEIVKASWIVILYSALLRGCKYSDAARQKDLCLAKLFSQQRRNKYSDKSSTCRSH